jgi:hypothetical protein
MLTTGWAQLLDKQRRLATNDPNELPVLTTSHHEMVTIDDRLSLPYPPRHLVVHEGS